MTIASHLPRRPRVLVLIAASVLLHYGAIGWLGSLLGLPPSPAAPEEPATIVAALHAAPLIAASEPTGPVLVPIPVRREAHRFAATASQLAGQPPAMHAVADPAPVAEAGAAETVTQVQSVAPPPEPEKVDEAAPAEAPGYKVSLPPPAELTHDVERTDAGGANWSGQAVMAWRRDGAAYRLSVVASVTMVVTINLVELTSEGTVGEQGIVPRLMTEKRRSKALTATHFAQGRITFSATPASYAMLPGTQDKATFPMQLAGIARADPAQLGSDIELMVGEDKHANPFRFVVQGQEEIDTGMGRMATWRLTRLPRPGSYSSRLDVWLAPGHEWYPVRIRSTEANGAVTTQTIRKIVMTSTGI